MPYRRYGVTVRSLVLAFVTSVSTSVPAALAWPGRPAIPPPKAPRPGAPPPAWIEAKAKSAWLAYGTYCWKTTCVDMIAPETRSDLPTFRITRGKTVRVHLGFVAKSVTVSIDKAPIRATMSGMRMVASWRATRGGIVTVSARGVGDASYIVRLRVR
jgi:hypothetical protein